MQSKATLLLLWYKFIISKQKKMIYKKENWTQEVQDYISALYPDLYEDMIKEHHYVNKYSEEFTSVYVDWKRKRNLLCGIRDNMEAMLSTRDTIIYENVKFYDYIANNCNLGIDDDGLLIIKTEDKINQIKPNKFLSSMGAKLLDMSRFNKNEIEISFHISNYLSDKIECSEFNRILETCQNPVRLEDDKRDWYALHLAWLFHNWYILTVLIYRGDECIARTLIRLYYDKDDNEIRCLDRLYTIWGLYGNSIFKYFIYNSLINYLTEKNRKVIIPKASKHDDANYFYNICIESDGYVSSLVSVSSDYYTTWPIPYFRDYGDTYRTYYDDCYTWEVHVGDNRHKHYKKNFYTITKK